MGYRSDVRIITTKKGFDELKKYTDKYLKDKEFKWGNLLDKLNVNEETKYAKYFGWDNIKWYEYCDGYENIDAIVKGLDYLEENNYSYRFARLGENYDDYEERSYESYDEKEQDLEYPYMVRYFDDENLINDMKRWEQ